MEYKEKGRGEYKKLAAGTEPVEDAMLAKLAAKSLKAGTYLVCLKAWDTYGNSRVFYMEFTYKKGNHTGSGEDTENGGASIDI